MQGNIQISHKMQRNTYRYRFRTKCKETSWFCTAFKGICRFRTTCNEIYRFRTVCNGIYRFCTTCKGMYCIDFAHHAKEYIDLAQRPVPQPDKKTAPSPPENPVSHISHDNQNIYDMTSIFCHDKLFNHATNHKSCKRHDNHYNS